MLRNHFKNAVCGLAFLLSGCSSTRYLLEDDGLNARTPVIDIRADPYYQFRLREVVERDLSTFGIDLRKLKIKVTVTDLDEPAAFSELEIIKEHIKMVATIEIYDDKGNLVSKNSVDSIAMYDVSDEFPYSGLASRKASIDVLLNDLGHAIALNIRFLSNLSEPDIMEEDLDVKNRT